MFSIVTTTALVAIGLLADCPTTPKTQTVADNIRMSPEPADMKDGSAAQNGDKCVVTLAINAKANAGPTGRSLPGVHIDADIPPSNDSDPARLMYADLDKSASRSIKTGGFDDLNAVHQASALSNSKAASGNRKEVAVCGFDVAVIGGIDAPHDNRAAPVVGTFEDYTATGNGMQTARTAASGVKTLIRRGPLSLPIEPANRRLSP